MQHRSASRTVYGAVTATGLALATLVAACDTTGPGQFISGGGGFFGAVSADEPQAAQIGRDVLNGGGNAIDAAVAMYFALSVTLPSAASLGANGVCLVNQYSSRRSEAISFSAGAAPGSPAGTTFAVPTAVRGMTLMHVKYGKARWEMLLAPAERLARPPGAPISRALARDLRAGAALIGRDSEGRRIFDRGGGVAYTEGDVFPQGDLSGILGALRVRGGQDFFAGVTAREISRAYREAGGQLPIEALRDAVPVAGAPLAASFGSHTAYFAPLPFAGNVAASAWEANAPAGLPPASAHEGGTAGFVAMDREGNAAACSVGMGQLFGARRIAPNTGIVIAAETGGNRQMLAPMLIANRNTGDVLFVGTASGTTLAPMAIGTAAAQAIKSRRPLDEILPASPAVLNVIACPDGVRQSAGTCRTASDAKGFGLSLLSDRPR